MKDRSWRRCYDTGLRLRSAPAQHERRAFDWMLWANCKRSKPALMSREQSCSCEGRNPVPPSDLGCCLRRNTGCALGGKASGGSVGHPGGPGGDQVPRSEEHTSELKSLLRISDAVFCL